MAEFNIAQIGTFDYENIGDLIFPTVLKAQLDKRIKIKNLFLFSLNNCVRPLDETKLNVYSIDRLEEIHNKYHIDAIILGGGDLLRFDNNLATEENYTSSNVAFDLIFYSIFFANKHKIPFLMNCPGAPFEFSDAENLLMNEYLKHVDYISVRDNKSAGILRGTGTDKTVNVFPDSVIAISQLIDVKSSLENLKSRYSFLQKEYFVFQSFPALNEAYPSLIIDQLKKLVKKYNLPIVMFPIGRVHNDHVFLKSLIDELKDERFIYIEEKLDLTQSLALLSGAKAFIGTSLHGNVISNSYGVPSVALDAGDLIKVRNSFKLLDREEYCIKDISALCDTVEKILEAPKLEKLKDAIESTNKHFDILAERIQQSPEKTLFISALRQTFYYKSQQKHSLTLYFDCGEGFSQENISQFFYYTDGDIHAEFTLPENCLTVRIDPIEQVFSAVKNLKITSDNEEVPYTHNGIGKDGIIFFNTTDPSLIVKTNNKKISIDFNIETMPIPYIEEMANEYNTLCLETDNLKRVINDTNNHVKNLDAIITSYRDALSERDEIISNLNNAINDLRNDICIRQAHIANMENSFSWKITAPIRKLKSIIKKCIGK